MADVPRVTIRRHGGRWPWEAMCSACDEERVYGSVHGAVAVNTRGIGNRTQQLALLAACLHLRWGHHG